MRTTIFAAALLAVTARAADAQNEAALRAAFEGRTVTIKLDMPATSQGVDLFPLDGTPLDFRELAQRIKDNGTAIRTGQQIMVTKVVVKRNSHIEFQLGGGGYGTFGDYMSSGSDVSVADAGESKAERALRDSIKAAPGPTKRKQFERELSNLRAERERENARAKAEAARANIARENSIRAKRVEAGSRFNIRFRNGIPPEALTPEGVVKALAQWVEFPGQPAAAAVAASPATAATPATVPVASLAPASGTSNASGTSASGAAGLTALRKGLTLREVETILGPAATAAEEKQGAMTVTKRTYRKDGMKVVASFVSDVMIDFSISPM